MVSSVRAKPIICQRDGRVGCEMVLAALPSVAAGWRRIEFVANPVM